MFYYGGLCGAGGSGGGVCAGGVFAQALLVFLVGVGVMGVVCLPLLLQTSGKAVLGWVVFEDAESFFAIRSSCGVFLVWLNGCFMLAAFMGS